MVWIRVPLEGNGTPGPLGSSGQCVQVHRQPPPPLALFCTVHPVLHGTRQRA
jgi:hypothetical protein